MLLEPEFPARAWQDASHTMEGETFPELRNQVDAD